MKTLKTVNTHKKAEVIAWLTIGVVIAVLAWVFSGASVCASI